MAGAQSNRAEEIAGAQLGFDFALNLVEILLPWEVVILVKDQHKFGVAQNRSAASGCF
jgi:hypothetical protein